MDAFETSAVVEGTGHVRVAGVPFAPGTQVEVVISPITGGEVSKPRLENAASTLLAALDKGRNTQPVGRLNRDELHERGNVH